MILQRNNKFTMQTSIAYIYISLLAALTFLTQCRPSTSTTENNGIPTQTAASQDTTYGAVAQLATSTPIETPLIKSYREAIAQAVKQSVPILAMPDSVLNTTEQLAQKITLQDKRLLQFLFDPQSKKPTRNEVFAIYPARQSDLPKGMPFVPNNFYIVEIYNFAANFTLIALVDMPANKVMDIGTIPQTQPNIPTYLKEIALQIATQSPEVQRALGYTPSAKQALMPDTKTALNRSRCERSRHLCVAPTFVQGEKALWAITDLTDLRLVGVRWTNVGNAGPTPPTITERKLQNEYLTECFCKTETELKRRDWQLNYMLTSSDGLRISNVTYKNKPVIDNAKLVDWHVSYSNTDGFGYSDAVGCPYFSTAAVVAVEAPVVEELKDSDQTIGFVLQQNFFSEGWPQPCNYNYQQRFEFYDDGRFRISCASLGRGCGNDGTYRPVMRIALAGSQQSFAEWDGTSWQNWTSEKWKQQQPTTSYTREGYQYKISMGNGDSGFYFIPGQGQFNDKGRGDKAYTYVTKRQQSEGEGDLPTIGPCCNTDYQQGPEKFIQPAPENIENQPLVLWYVPELKNDDTKGREYCWAESFIENGVYTTRTYPCYSGPMFVPF